jgi:hypothetical protein
MTLRLVLRSLSAQPVRSLVLAVGFGLGIAAMAGLLGVGEVVLEQSRSPVLKGGGDVVVTGAYGRVPSARFLLSSVLASPPLEGRSAFASPSVSATLYLVREGRNPMAIRARGGIPSLEQGVGDTETTEVVEWTDALADLAWVSPAPADVLRAMDRFHPVPDVPEREDSWAEWLYFNGRGDDASFYLSFLVGPPLDSGRRRAGVRLQLERSGRLVTFSDRAEIPEDELLAGAPDMRIGRSHVRLDGLRYRIHLELFEEANDPASRAANGEADLFGDLTLEAVPGRSLPPIRIRGAAGWVSGYVVPVLSGPLDGRLEAGGDIVEFRQAQGYHDHNWGFWQGVTWQWGQVAGPDVSLVYGRVLPPPDAADPRRMPGFLIALGPDGPLGYATNVRIEESDDAGLGYPASISVQAGGGNLSLAMELSVEDAVRTRFQGGPLGDRQSDLEFYQLRALFRVSGSVGARRIDFSGHGAAETFRGRPGDL